MIATGPVPGAAAEARPRSRALGHIGLAGPARPREFAADLGADPDELPEGMGGTPVNHLARAWLDMGYRVTLATLDRSVPVDGDLRVVEGEALTLVVGPYRPRRRARDAFRVERAAITEGLRRFRPDAISAQWSYEFALGAIASGIPSLVTVRDVPAEIFRMQPSAYRLVRWWMHRASMSRATAVAFNSPYTKRRVRHRRAEGAQVLPNMLPDATWSLAERGAPDPTAPRYVSVNNGFSRWKNLPALLHAFAKVRAEVSAAELSLLGTGFGPGGAAERWASRHQLASGVRFQGPAPYAEILAAIRGADALVHPSLEESFGNTLIEAASVGTPVIAGRASGAVPWVLADGVAGVLVDVTEPQAIARAMTDLVRDPGVWASLRRDAFASTRDRFAASVVARDYVGTLQRIARAGPARDR